MWSLRKDSTRFNFIVGKEYNVGRRNGHLLLENDTSVSRLHASLSVIHPEENLVDIEKTSILKLKDVGSKYGTFHNDVRLDKNQEVELKNGDIVRFGQLDSIFSVVFEPLIITTSCVDHNMKTYLKFIIQKLGGHVVPEWRPDCTHLIMSAIKVTIKALCCLVSLKPIIHPRYINDLIKSFSQNTSLEDLEKYLPPIDEPLIDSQKAIFKVLPQRKTLFQDKIFVFFDDKQMKKLQLAIFTAGGNTRFISENSGVDNDFYVKPGTCVVTPADMSTTLVKETTKLLNRHKKRLIPESEFGLAVAYASVEKFCNPDFNIGANLLGNPDVQSQTFTQEEVYVPESVEFLSSRKRARRQNEELAEEVSASKRKKSSYTSVTHVEESEDLPSTQNVTHVDESQDINDESDQDTSRVSSRTKTRQSFSSPIVNSRADRVLLKNTNSSLSKSPPVHVVVSDEEGDDDVQFIEMLDKSDSSMVLGPTQKLEPLDVPSNQSGISESVSEREKSPLPPVTRPSVSSSPIPPVTSSANLSNGFRSTAREINYAIDSEENLPRNLFKITMVNLVKPRNPITPVALSASDSNGINYKRFKKVLPAGFRALPRIIGGGDLVPHTRIPSQRTIDDFVMDDDDDEMGNLGSGSNHSDNRKAARGKFDWPDHLK